MEPRDIIIKFIKNNYISGKPISQNDLVEFVVNYCIVCKKPTPNASQINVICQLIGAGIFNLEYAIENASCLLDIPIRKIYNKQGAIICKYIED